MDKNLPLEKSPRSVLCVLEKNENKHRWYEEGGKEVDVVVLLALSNG